MLKNGYEQYKKRDGEVEEMSIPQAIIFDMDGVIYRGARGVPGVAREISRLQRKTRVLFLTNNATKSRKEYVRHLGGYGIRAKESEIMTAALGCAKYVREKYGTGKGIYVVGEQGLHDELEAVGAKLVEGKGAKLVVVGLDREFTYEKLAAATNNIIMGAKFILANSDPTYPAEKGLMPGSGAIAAAISYACGKEPDVVLGKPSHYLANLLAEEHNIDPKKAVFVGDRLDIDIRMANGMGMTSVLVLSGIARKEDLAHISASEKPKIIVESAATLGRALGI